MTVSTTAVVKTYTGDGVTTAFPTTFQFYAASDLKVYLDGVLQATGYSVTGGLGSTGTVTFTSAPAAAAAVKIRRQTARTQAVDIANNTSVLEQVLEEPADRATLLSQEALDFADRGVVVPTGETGIELPALATRKGKIAAFDATTGALYGERALTTFDADVAAAAASATAAAGSASSAASSASAAAGSATAAAGSASGASASAAAAATSAARYITVKGYGAVGDGVTSDQTAVANAVAAAYAAGAELYWEAGTYLTTASIANFHSVRHRGPGAVKRSSQVFYVEPNAAQSNIVWVDATGADTNDGLSSLFPIKEIRTAVALLANYDAASGCEWTVQAAAGTYKGGILVPRGWSSCDFLKIKGASAAHPTASTTLIDKAADTAATYGIAATDGTLVWIENVKIIGAFAQGVYVNKNVYLQWRNVHVDGAATGLQLNVHCRYFVTGGKISNCTSYGINELFHVTRSFDTVSAAADQLIIEFAGKTGLKAKENCVGHLDYLNIQDCPVGVEFQLYSGANVGNLNLKRCQLGVVLVNSELHEYTSLVWGSGADACTRRVKRRGNSSVIEMFGWTPDGGLTVTQGHAPPIKLASNYTAATVTGTTTETDVANWASILKTDFYAVAGSRYTVRAWGRTGAGGALAGTSRVLLRTGGTFMTDVTLPIGTPANAFWEAEWEVICTSDGNNQIAKSKLLVEGASSAGLVDVTMIARTVDMASVDRGVALSVTNSVSGDSNVVWGAELYG